MYPKAPWPITLLDDGSVITEDGEVLGKWDALNDAIYTFTPLGSEVVIISDSFRGSFCESIKEWHEAREAT